MKKENEGLKQKLKELQEKNRELQDELDKPNEELNVIMEAVYEDREVSKKEADARKDDITRLKKELKKKDAEEEKLENDVRAQNEKNIRLQLQNLIYEPDEEGNEEEEEKINALMLQLKNEKDVKLLRQGIEVLLDYAQKRLPCTASKFGLEDTENSGEQTGGVYNDYKRIAQKNAADSFVHTVSRVQENIMAVWKRMTLLLKPKALSKKKLEQAMADADKRKINSEAEKKKQAVEQEKDAEIAGLKKELEKMKIGHNMKVLDLENKLRRAGVAGRGKHMRNTKTEADLSIYKRTDVSGMGKEKSHNENRFETPVARNRSRDMFRNASYSRSYQRSDSQSQTFLETFQNSDSHIKYRESQIKEEEGIWKNGDWQQQMSFKGQCGNSNSLGIIPEMRNETNERTLSEWPELQKMWRQLLERLDAYLSKKKNINKLEWKTDLTKQISDWNRQGKKLFSDTEKISQMFVVKRQSVKKGTGYLVTPKGMTKTKTVPNLWYNKTEKKPKDSESKVHKNLLPNFNNEESDVKNNDNKKNNLFKNSNKSNKQKRK